MHVLDKNRRFFFKIKVKNLDWLIVSAILGTLVSLVDSKKGDLKDTMQYIN